MVVTCIHHFTTNIIVMYKHSNRFFNYMVETSKQTEVTANSHIAEEFTKLRQPYFGGVVFK